MKMLLKKITMQYNNEDVSIKKHAIIGKDISIKHHTNKYILHTFNLRTINYEEICPPIWKKYNMY